MPDLILHLGSNLGDRTQQLQQAKGEIQQKIGYIYSQSTFYQTAAWGKTDQADFHNQALRVRTQNSAEDCLQICMNIEKKLGRVRLEHWGPRSIDIDLITYGHQIYHTEALTLPHPRLHLRRFVLVPLQDIIPDWRHPILHKTVREMLADCEDDLVVEPIT